MLSFHNDPAIKEYYVNQIKAHAAADKLVKGQYWEGGKGCAVGCVVHGDNHADYETLLGLPEWLARLEDSLFENLPNGHAKEFAVQFLQIIPVGVELSRVKHRFCSFLMGENLDRVQSLNLPEAIKTQVVEAIQQVKNLHDLAAETGKVDESATWSAESAAWSAARSAAWSAWSAESAAWSARSAASAARSARSAAWSAAFIRYAAKLLKLLQQA